MSKTEKKEWQGTDGIGHHSDASELKEGVYIFCSHHLLTGKSRAIYVGRSSKLSNRLKHHPVYRQALNDGLLVSARWKYTTDSKALEIALIKKLKPKYNQQHNG